MPKLEIEHLSIPNRIWGMLFNFGNSGDFGNYQSAPEYHPFLGLTPALATVYFSQFPVSS
jgi:hypothetical protein